MTNDIDTQRIRTRFPEPSKMGMRNFYPVRVRICNLKKILQNMVSVSYTIGNIHAS